VLKFKADSIGNEEMSELSTPQDFKGFYASSRVTSIACVGITLCNGKLRRFMK